MGEDGSAGGAPVGALPNAPRVVEAGTDAHTNSIFHFVIGTWISAAVDIPPQSDILVPTPCYMLHTLQDGAGGGSFVRRMPLASEDLASS
jgi:hypothetical protein